MPEPAPSLEPDNPHRVGLLVTNRITEALQPRNLHAAYEYPGFVSVLLPDDAPFHTADFGLHGWDGGDFTVLTEDPDDPPGFVDYGGAGFALDCDLDETDPDLIAAAFLRALATWSTDGYPEPE